MPKLKGKIIGFSVLYTIIMSSLVIGVYYATIIYPKLTSTKALFNTKADIYNLYSLNVEEKLATNGLIALKPTSTNFYEEKGSLIGRAEEVQEKLTESLSSTKVTSKGTKETKEFLKEIEEALTKDLEENAKILDEKKEILTDYKKVESIVDKAFGFSPTAEFGRYKYPEDKETALESVATTRNGIMKISTELKSLDKYQNPNLYNSIDEVIELLDKMESTLEKNSFPQFADNVESLTEEYSNVVAEAKDTLNSILTSEKALKVLTDQTNIILEYEFLMSRIEEKQLTSK